MSNQNVTFSVSDMHCASCPKVIKLSLLEIDGVQSAEASLEDKSVTVFFDSAKTNTPLLVKAIEEIGYTATQKA